MDVASSIAECLGKLGKVTLAVKHATNVQQEGSEFLFRKGFCNLISHPYKALLCVLTER